MPNRAVSLPYRKRGGGGGGGGVALLSGKMTDCRWVRRSLRGMLGLSAKCYLLPSDL